MKEIFGKIIGIIVIIFFIWIALKILDNALYELSSPPRYSPSNLEQTEMPFPVP